jgi:ABC-type multidrug transport system fused ATPase/permease subunit
MSTQAVPGLETGSVPSTALPAPAPPLRRLDVASFILSRPLYLMLVLLVLEALLSATTTWLVIQAGRDVASGYFMVTDLVWIFVAQTASYMSGAVSWVFAEQAGYRAFGRYILRFARINRHETRLLNDKTMREQVEPFLTGETFYIFFHLMYELEGDLKLLLGLVFNAIVLGMEIDAGLPIAYAAVFAALFTVQLLLRNPIANAYLLNQQMTNRMTAQGYTAWDNVFVGNRYNLRLWLAGFKSRLRDALRAQIKAVVAREGMSAMGGILALAVVFGVMILIAARDTTDAAVLIAMAATLPRQIEMTHDVHQLASGWNELVAIWARIAGVTDNMRPAADPAHDERIQFDRLILREGDEVIEVRSLDDALRAIASRPTGRINVRGGNGSGKSTLLATLKAILKTRAYYWPTTDRLAFRFGESAAAEAAQPTEAAKAAEPTKAAEPVKAAESAKAAEPTRTAEAAKPAAKGGRRRKRGFSSGEQQLRSLQEIVTHTEAAAYLLDEWDANLDRKNRTAAEQLIEQLAQRARVVEISHRDRA